MTEPLVRIELLGVPVPLWTRSQEHSDELMREFALIVADRARAHDDHEVPHRLTALIDELTTQYAGFGENNEQLLRDAAEAGTDSVDLIYEMPAEVAPAAGHLSQLLDEADDYCRRGQHLLTLATPPQQVAFRRWFLEEFVRQVSGESPLPWPDYATGAQET